MVVSERPVYTVVVMQNPKRRLAADVNAVTLLADPGPVGDVLRRCQVLGSSEGYNWVIDQTGEVFELAGWDWSAVNHPEDYAICLVLTGQEYPPAQRDALIWLLNQLARKRGISPEVSTP